MQSTSNTNKGSFPRKHGLVRRKLCMNNISVKTKSMTREEEVRVVRFLPNLLVSQP
jgi:hypothetical protein